MKHQLGLTFKRFAFMPSGLRTTAVIPKLMRTKCNSGPSPEPESLPSLTGETVAAFMGLRIVLGPTAIKGWRGRNTPHSLTPTIPAN